VLLHRGRSGVRRALERYLREGESGLKLSEDLTCAELVELVTDYLEGALPEQDRVRFEEHVVVCRACASYLDQMRITVALTGRLSADDLAAEVQETLLAAFRGWKERV
jgi:anti-sigma factor RsiW